MHMEPTRQYYLCPISDELDPIMTYPSATYEAQDPFLATSAKLLHVRALYCTPPPWLVQRWGGMGIIGIIVCICILEPDRARWHRYIVKAP